MSGLYVVDSGGQPRLGGAVRNPNNHDLPGFTLVLNEEFTGSSVDTTKWFRESGTYGQGNNRVGRWRHQNLTVSNGTLKMLCQNDGTSSDGGSSSRWTGGMISTRDVGVFYPTYGRYEMRARLHHGQGIWPAFWLRHRDGSNICEVDIMEYFHAQIPGRTSGVLHRTPNSGSPSPQTNVYNHHYAFEPVVAEGLQGWHTWAVDILPEGANVRFRWYFDGVQTGTFLDTSPNFWKDRYTDEAFDVTLQGSQIGGNFAGHPNDPLGGSRWPGNCFIGGSWPNCSAGPYQGNSVRRSEVADTSAGGQQADVVGMEVDYVRVWKHVN